MPHQFMIIACKKCAEFYCPACIKFCPKCDEFDIADVETMCVRTQMRLRVNQKKSKPTRHTN